MSNIEKRHVSPTDSIRDQNSQAAATVPDLEEVRLSLLDHFDEANSAGKVYWERDRVVDRTVSIDGFPGNVRFVPTFAQRIASYDGHGPTCGCRLCAALDNSDIVIPVSEINTTDPAFMRAFDESFAVCLNNYPYFEGQLMLASREHETTFTDEQYIHLFKFMERTQFSGAAMQIEGSGATIPDHAHISIFDEPLPIFSADYHTVDSDGETAVATASNYPAVCYKVYGGSVNTRFERVAYILDRLAEHEFSFNLFLDKQGSAYVVPRTTQRSPSMDWKVGVTHISGVGTGYVEQAATNDIEQLEYEIWQNCVAMTGLQIAIALRETTLQGDPMQIFTKRRSMDGKS